MTEQQKAHAGVLDNFIGAPVLLRKEPKLELYPPYTCTVVRISRLLLELDAVEAAEDEGAGKKAEELYVANAEIINRIIAQALWNKNSDAPDDLVKQINETFTERERAATLMILYRRLGYEDFFTCMDMLKGVEGIILDTPETLPSMRL